MKAFFQIEIVPAAAILAVTALYIFLVPVSPYWLDSPEFTASAFSLSLSHPPGHPLYETAGKLFALLPAGSVAFRMNFFSTACCALALVFTVLLGARIMTAGFSIGKNTAVLMATLAILPVALSPGWIHQATHAEVYGFEVMLLAAMLWLASHYLVAPPPEEKNVPNRQRDDRFRWLLAALLFFSLSLSLHPFISLIMLPALAASIGTAAVLDRWPAPGRRLLLLSASLCAGLLVYLFIIVRGNVAPTMIMGKIETPGDFLWTISAKVFQKSAAVREAGVMRLKGTGSIFMLARESGLLLPFISLGGLYFLLRKRHLAPMGLLLTLGLLLSVASRTFMPFDTSNPDVFGYLMIALVIMAASACSFFAAASKIRLGRPLSFVILAGLAASAAAPSAANIAETRGLLECSGRTMFLLEKSTTGRAPPFARIFSSFFSTTFLHYFDEKVTSSRPDVLYTGLPFLGYRGVASETARSSPEMKKVISDYIATGGLQPADLATLALAYPVFLEPYPDIPDDFLPYMIPDGAGFAFYPQPSSIKDFKAAADEGNEAIAALLRSAGACLAEPQTGRYLLWLIYNRTLLIARRGDSRGAIESARLGLKIYPDVPELRKLIEALQKSRGPLTDIAPFLPPKID